MKHQAPDPVGLYEPFTVHSGMVFVSGISSAENGGLITGKVGADVNFEGARRAARRAARNLLTVLLEAAGGDPERIDRLLMLRGHVNAAQDFGRVHHVIDAASELIIAELGDRGRHARTAIGCSTLPNFNVVTLDAVAVIGGSPD